MLLLYNKYQTKYIKLWAYIIDYTVCNFGYGYKMVWQAIWISVFNFCPYSSLCIISNSLVYAAPEALVNAVTLADVTHTDNDHWS